MRKGWIIGSLVGVSVIGAAFAGGSLWAARLFEDNFASTIDFWRSQGLRIDFDTEAARGTLLELRKPLNDLEVTLPSGSDVWSIRAERQTLQIEPWRPFRLDIALHRDSSTEIASTVSEQRLKLDQHDGHIRLELASDGQLSGISTWAVIAMINGNFGGAMIRELTADVAFDGVQNETTRHRSVVFATSLTDVTLDLHQQPLLGDRLTRLIVEGYVLGGFPGADPRQAAATWRDAGGTIELERMVANWGPLALTADGTLALDGNLQPIGAFTATVRGYNETVDAVVDAGLMTPAQGTATKLWLNAKAEGDAGDTKVKLPITIQDGFVTMGPVKLAQLPPIQWQ